MKKKLTNWRNYFGAVASLLFGLMNFSSFGYCKEPLFLFGGVIGFVSVVGFFTLMDNK